MCINKSFSSVVALLTSIFVLLCSPAANISQISDHRTPMEVLSVGFEPETVCFDGDQVEPIDLEEEAIHGQKILKRVEQQFIGYFLRQIGPSK